MDRTANGSPRDRRRRRRIQLTDAGSLVTDYGTFIATVGLVFATGALAWHSRSLVKATDNLASVQLIPRLTLRHPIRGTKERKEQFGGTNGPRAFVVEVVNHGNGTAFRVEILGGESHQSVTAKTLAPNRDVIPHGVKRFILPDWDERMIVTAKYEDARGRRYEIRLYPLLDEGTGLPINAPDLNLSSSSSELR